MATLKQILFRKYTDKGLDVIVEEMKKKYDKKKADDLTMTISPTRSVAAVWLMRTCSLR